MNDRENIYCIIYVFFSNQGIMYLKCLYLRNCLLFCAGYRYNYDHIKKLYMYVVDSSAV